MDKASLWIDFIDQWQCSVEKRLESLVKTIKQEQNDLSLELETQSLFFEPSSALYQLLVQQQKQDDDEEMMIKSNNKEESRLQTYKKTSEYLERKLESELRRHYELENTKVCEKWNDFYTTRQVLGYKEFLRKIDQEKDQLKSKMECSMSIISPSPSSSSSSSSSFSSAISSITFTTAKHTTNSMNTTQEDIVNDEEETIEKWQKECEKTWIQQERFNVQEAFSNQMKKIEQDYENFISTLEEEFEKEKQAILKKFSRLTTQAASTPSVPSSKQSTKPKKSSIDAHFKSNTKRKMLVNTAKPVVFTMSKITRKPTPTHTEMSDVNQKQEETNSLIRRYGILKENALRVKKDGMKWIARQCAHLFTQLDVKESEHKLRLLIEEQHIQQLHEVKATITSYGKEVKQYCQLHLDQLPQNIPQEVFSIIFSPNVSTKATGFVQQQCLSSLSSPSSPQQIEVNSHHRSKHSHRKRR